MTVREQLVAARELIAVPERWTQGTFALDRRGDDARARDPAAVAWCAQGACIAVGAPKTGGANRVLRAAMGARSISIWNDNPARTHAEVLAAFDRAIEAEGDDG